MKLEWLTPPPALKLGRWEVYPTDQATLLFRFEDSLACAQLHTFGGGSTELEFLSPCCGGGVSRSFDEGVEERYCRGCGETLTYCDTDGALSSEAYWGLEDWLVVEGVEVLTAQIAASELLDFTKTLGLVRDLIHSEDLEKMNRDELIKSGRADFLSYPYPESPCRLYWTAEVLTDVIERVTR